MLAGYEDEADAIRRFQENTLDAYTKHDFLSLDN